MRFPCATRHVVTDTAGLLVGAVVHPADIQDRDGAGLVIAAATTYSHGCAISLPTAAGGDRRVSTAAAPLGGRTNPGLAQSQPPPGKGLRGIDRQFYRLDLHCFYATPRPAACVDTTITILGRTT